MWAANHDSWAYFFFCSRLYVLQGGLAQQEWRVPELLHRLLQYLEPKLTQVYKNVRERIGRWGSFHTLGCDHGVNHSKTIETLFGLLYSVLTYIFMIDVNLPLTQPTTSPRISDFTERILLQLKPLTEGDEEIQNHVIEENEVEVQDERTQAIKLLKTGIGYSMWSELFGWILVKVWSTKYLISQTYAVLKWLIASAGRSFSTPVADQLRLLPLLFKVKCIHLQHHLKIIFPNTSHNFLPVIYLPSVSDCSSWEWWQLRWTEERCQNLPVSDVSGTSLHRADPDGSQCSPGGKIPQSFLVSLYIEE